MGAVSLANTSASSTTSVKNFFTSELTPSQFWLLGSLHCLSLCQFVFQATTEGACARLYLQAIIFLQVQPVIASVQLFLFDYD